MPRPRQDHRLKALIAQECARLMADEGVRDFQTAKRKAALRLAVADRASLPTNAEIEQALLDRQRLFHGHRQPLHLRDLREAALNAMRFLARFHPRLVGPVLSGTAGPHTGIHLHLFADTSEEVALFLLERHVPFELAERRFKMAGGGQICVPAFQFTAEDTCFDLTVFSLLAEREAPLSPVNNRPMRRANMAELEALLTGSHP